MQSDEVVRSEAPEAASHPPASGYEAEEHAGAEEHVHLSPQSVWPITMAAGLTFVGAGLVTTTPIIVLGVVTMFISLVSWIQELRHEPH